MKKIVIALMLTTCNFAMADLSLVNNGKKIECYGPADNFSWVINAKRTTVKHTVEGESLGPQKITKKTTDGVSYVSYTTNEGTLTLSSKGDTYLFDGADPETELSEIECH